MTDPWKCVREPHYNHDSVIHSGKCESNCPHKRQVIELKQRLQNSLTETQSFMMESSTIVDSMRNQFETSQTLLEEEIKYLKEKIDLLENKNTELITMNTETLNHFDKQLLETEKKIIEVEKKEEKDTVFNRLYQNGRKKPPTITRKSLPKLQLP